MVWCSRGGGGGSCKVTQRGGQGTFLPKGEPTPHTETAKNDTSSNKSITPALHSGLMYYSSPR